MPEVSLLSLLRPVVLKLDVWTLILFKGCQSLSVFFHNHIFIVVCSFLGSQKIENILKGVAKQKSLRTPDLALLNKCLK